MIGLKVDVDVVEKILGWTRIEPKDPEKNFYVYPRGTHWIDTEGMTRYRVPSPSTNYSDAMKVIDELVREGNGVEVRFSSYRTRWGESGSIYVPDRYPSRYRDYFDDDTRTITTYRCKIIDTCSITGNGKGETIQESMCMAALDYVKAHRESRLSATRDTKKIQPGRS